MASSTILLNGVPFRCELALTSREHSIGLSKHAGLGEREGMLFIFDQPATRTFWMSEVRFPIDIIALDQNSRVAKVVEGALPGTLERWTFAKCSAVIEVPGGTCRRVGLRVGHEVTAQEDEEHLAEMGVEVEGAPSDEGGSTFDASDVFDESEVAPTDSTTRSPDAALEVGERFKVGRFGFVWIVVRADGASGFCQRQGHKRKWFGYSHNRETGEVTVYPVKQGSGDRIGDPVAFGPLNKVDEQGQPKQAQARRPSKYIQPLVCVVVTYEGDRVVAGVGASTWEADEDASYNGPYSDVETSDPVELPISRAAADLVERGLCVVGSDLVETPEGIFAPGEPVVRRQAQERLLELEDGVEPIEDHEPHRSTEPGGKSFDEPKEEYFEDLFGEQLAQEALDVDTSLQTRIGQASYGSSLTVSRRIQAGRNERIQALKAKYPNRDVEGLAALDPTSNGSYIEWLVERVGVPDESLRELLTAYDNLKKRKLLPRGAEDIKRLDVDKLRVAVEEGKKLAANKEEDDFHEGKAKLIHRNIEQLSGTDKMQRDNEALSDRGELLRDGSFTFRRLHNQKEIAEVSPGNWCVGWLNRPSHYKSYSAEQDAQFYLVTTSEQDANAPWLLFLSRGPHNGECKDRSDSKVTNAELVESVEKLFGVAISSAVGEDEAERIRDLTDPRALSEYARSRNPIVLTALAANTHTSKVILRALSHHPDVGVRTYIANNSSSPPEVLAKLAGDVDVFVRYYVAKNTSSPPEVLAKLARDADVVVRHTVAKNTSSPPEVLANFAEDVNVGVRHSVAKNTSSPPEVLAKLTRDADVGVRERAHMTLATLKSPKQAPQARIGQLDVEADIEVEGMPKIHDDPDNPMTVWRVENEQGEGPYNSGEAFGRPPLFNPTEHEELDEKDLWMDDRPPQPAPPKPKSEDDLLGMNKLIRYDYHQRVRPSPVKDFPEKDINEAGFERGFWGMSPKVDMFGNRMGPRTEFAFETPEHAKRWFGEYGLADLKDRGFELKETPAGRVWRSDTGRQVMIQRPDAIRREMDRKRLRREQSPPGTPSKKGSQDSQGNQGSHRTAQIVDEAKFVEKVADILAAHVGDLQWQPDVLNGGATERTVVTRSVLAGWLGAPANAEMPTGAAPEATTYILQAASTEQGLRLIGSSLVLAEMADFTRLGFANRQPMLIAYREKRETSPEVTGDGVGS